LKDESGATAIEYGLIAAGIAIAIITAVNGVGSQLSTNFNTISNLAEVIAHFGGVSGPGVPSARSLSFGASIAAVKYPPSIHSRRGHCGSRYAR
jgi:pilus assembly protein Flp/PilA